MIFPKSSESHTFLDATAVKHDECFYNFLSAQNMVQIKSKSFHLEQIKGTPFALIRLRKVIHNVLLGHVRGR